ncbi:hypothetical protein DPMN_040908 [Dreissena polymorpha]|uniref:Uncharacterized protein n=1 Tax=Dreissena polymorpha TaxID=45954 RepID=A0A9D4HVM2_DREPO|nr:hypothetical protein DPMN_040908 [Dreissena polymorpha]
MERDKMGNRRLHATLIVSTVVSMDCGMSQTVYHVTMEQRFIANRRRTFIRRARQGMVLTRKLVKAPT